MNLADLKSLSVDYRNTGEKWQRGKSYSFVAAPWFRRKQQIDRIIAKIENKVFTERKK